MLRIHKKNKSISKRKWLYWAESKILAMEKKITKKYIFLRRFNVAGCCSDLFEAKILTPKVNTFTAMTLGTSFPIS